ncbi:MAG: hypothetical protein QW751_02845 [Candidatus Aenigmatarchaeota archaeon]
MSEKQYTGQVGTCPNCGKQTLKQYTRRFMTIDKVGAECSSCGYTYEKRA